MPQARESFPGGPFGNGRRRFETIFSWTTGRNGRLQKQSRSTSHSFPRLRQLRNTRPPKIFARPSSYSVPISRQGAKHYGTVANGNRGLIKRNCMATGRTNRCSLARDDVG